MKLFRKLSNTKLHKTYSTEPKIENGYDYFDIEKKVMNKINLKNQKLFRIGLIASGTLLISSLIFHKQIKRYFGKQSSDIAVIVFDNEQVNIKAEQFAQNIVSAILKDPAIMDKAKQFIIALCNDEEIKIKISELLVNCIQTEQVNNVVTQLVIDLVNNKYIIDEVTKLINTVLSSNATQETVNKGLDDACQSILNNENINKQSKEFVQLILNDEKLHDELKNKIKKVIADIVLFR